MREDELNVAKIVQLSRRDIGKSYSSMVASITISSEAK